MLAGVPRAVSLAVSLLPPHLQHTRRHQGCASSTAPNPALRPALNYSSAGSPSKLHPRRRQPLPTVADVMATEGAGTEPSKVWPKPGLQPSPEADAVPQPSASAPAGALAGAATAAAQIPGLQPADSVPAAAATAAPSPGDGVPGASPRDADAAPAEPVETSPAVATGQPEGEEAEEPAISKNQLKKRAKLQRCAPVLMQTCCTRLTCTPLKPASFAQAAHSTDRLAADWVLLPAGAGGWRSRR